MLFDCTIVLNWSGAACLPPERARDASNDDAEAEALAIKCLSEAG
jgi:hypothetical protein